jgi:fermentation-respiration switch protein FrsA (DUF1100 family)
MKLLPHCLLFCCLPALLCGCDGVNGMFYYPDRQVYDTPDRHGLHYEAVTFTSRDGTRLSGWFIQAVGTAKGTVVHFHGNAQNMTAHFGFVSWLPAQGFNLFVFDYRGYGTSAGKPQRRGIFEDCLAALDYVEQRPGIARDRLLVLGQSLGGANAIVALGSTPRPSVRAVAIDSAFASYQGIVRDKIGEMPLLSLLRTPLSRLLIGDSLSPEAFVASIAPTPLLIIHGTADAVIPYRHGQRLFELARQPKQFWSLEGGGHTSVLDDEGYRRRLVTFFLDALAQKELSPGENNKNH